MPYRNEKSTPYKDKLCEYNTLSLTIDLFHSKEDCHDYLLRQSFQDWYRLPQYVENI
jgi:hypothetical protein